MPRIVDIQAEVADLSEWDTVDDAGSHASATAAAAMGSSRYGWQMAIVGSDQIRLRKELSWHPESKTIRGRFYFDPNGISLADAVTRVIATLWNVTDGNVMRVFFTSSGGYTVAIEYMEDGGGTSSTTSATISDAPHWIEFEIKRASSATASDGHVKLWVDDTLEDTDTGLDIFDLGRPTEFRLTWDTNNNAGDSGTLYFDEVFINDDGNPIGEKWLSTILFRETFDGGLTHLSKQNLLSRIEVETTAALAGSPKGISVDVGTSGPFLGEVFSHAWTTDVMRFRVHVNVNNVSLADANARRIFGLWDAAYSALRDGIEIKDDSGYQVRAFATEDASTGQTGWYSLNSDSDHVIEVEIVRASTNVASDGTLKLWVDGTLQETVTGLDIFDQTRADGWLIEWSLGNAGDSGTIFVDEVELRDKARLIGSAVEPTHGHISVTADGVGFDYIDGTGQRNDSLGASPSTFSFESYERPPDGDPDFVFTRTLKDSAGNVNRTETFFAGKLTGLKQLSIEPSRVSRWAIEISDQRHVMARTLLSQMINGQQRADQALQGALNGSGLTSAGWTLDADEGPTVDPQTFADTPMNEVMEHYAKAGGMLCWVSYDKVVHLKLPETLLSPHEIDRENPSGHWYSHDYDEDRGRIANYVKGVAQNGTTAIQQDSTSQSTYGLRPITVQISTVSGVHGHTQLQNAALVILNARKDPLVEGSVMSDYDRLAIGENTLITDLDRGLRDVAVRIHSLSWSERDNGVWELTVGLTNDTVLAALTKTGEKVAA